MMQKTAADKGDASAGDLVRDRRLNQSKATLEIEDYTVGLWCWTL